jgi:teichuronic acid biosynthesis protein TuaE
MKLLDTDKLPYKIISILFLTVISVIFLKYNLINSYFTLIAFAGGYILLLLIFRKWSIYNFDLERSFMFLAIGLSFLQAAFLTVKIGSISIFPYRLLFLILFLLILVRLLRNELKIYAQTISVNGYLLFLLAWLFYSLVSLSWVKSFNSGFRYLFLLGIGVFMVYFVVLLFQKEGDYLKFFYLWIGMLVMLVLVGLWNHLTQQHLSTSSILNAPPHKKHIPTAVFFNQNDYASYLAVSSFFLISFIKYIKSHLLKIIGVIILALSMYLIYVTESRASLLAVLLAVAGMAFVILKPKTRIILSMLLIGFVTLLISTQLDTATAFLNNEQTSDNSVNIRTNLIKNALYFTSESLGFGVGSGNAEYYMKNYFIYPTQNVLNVHNWLLEILVNNGVLIFIGYILLYLSLIIKIFYLYKTAENPVSKMIAEALLGALFVFAFASISPSSVSNLNYHWMLLAFSIGYINMSKINRKERKI